MQPLPIIALELCVGDCVLHANTWKTVASLAEDQGDPSIILATFSDGSETTFNTQTRVTLMETEEEEEEYEDQHDF